MTFEVVSTLHMYVCIHAHTLAYKHTHTQKPALMHTTNTNAAWEMTVQFSGRQLT